MSSWFSRADVNSLQAVYDGNPLDRTVYLLLIFAGIGVLFARRFELGRYVSANKWVVIFFAYLCVSLLWSDYTFIAFKRWFKDLGNLIMVLVVVSETNPLSATKGLFIRTAYVLVPISALVTKYFPEIGRYYDQWGRAYDAAIGADKNMLGMTLTVLALVLVWGLIEAGKEKPHGGKRLEQAVYSALLVVIVWLLRMADCATAMACIGVGVIVMVSVSLSPVRRWLRVWVAVGVTTGILIAIPDVRAAVLEPVVELLGRNMTFTGRDLVWRTLLAEDINPLVGTGAYSFWMGDRIDVGIPGLPGANEAHNAYLEIYLNIGLVGLALYAALLVSGTRRLVAKLVRGETDGGERFCFAFMIVVIAYGVTEAVIRQNLIWLGLLLVVSIGSMRNHVAAPVASTTRGPAWPHSPLLRPRPRNRWLDRPAHRAHTPLSVTRRRLPS